MKTLLRIGIMLTLIAALCLCFSADAFADNLQTYKITLNANGGYFNNDTNVVTKECFIVDGELFSGWNNQPSNSNLHFVFNGWFYDSNCTDRAINRDESFAPDGDLTLYAGWSEGWVVTFDANGGRIGDDTTMQVSIEKGNSPSYIFCVESPDPDLRFNCWSLEDGTVVNLLDYIPENDVTLYAQYVRFYQITLNANGGFFNNDLNKVSKTESINEGNTFYAGKNNVVNPDPHLAFSGWYYDVACTQLAVGRGEEFTPDSDLTLYAGWDEGWIVTFDANGGRFYPDNNTFLYTIPKGSRLEFYPYAEAEDSEHVWCDYWTLEDGTQIFVWDYVPKEDVTLYAHYTHFYNLTFNANGGYFENNPRNTVLGYRVSTGESYYSRNYTPTNPDAHLAFNGWYYDEACTQLAVGRDDNFLPTNDVVLYAGWTEGWIVTFDANGGRFDSGNSTLLYTVPIGDTLSYSPYVESTDPNYGNDYWMLEDGTRISEWAFVPEGDVTLYAHYIRTYCFTLDANGGFFDNDPGCVLKTTHVREDRMFYGGNYQPTNPDPHMAFNGWYYDSECTQLAVSHDGSLTPDSDLTLYAGWSEGWIVTFDANGGTFYYNGTTVLVSTVLKGDFVHSFYGVMPTEEDMQFDSWVLEDGTRINDWAFFPESDVTLYAHYVRTYEVTFDANGGYFDNDPNRRTSVLRIPEGNQSSYFTPKPKNPDPRLTSNGWYYDPECTEPAINWSISPERDITLYAGWTDGWIVTFEAEGGYFDGDKETYTVTVQKGSPLNEYPYPFAESRESWIWFDYYVLEDGTRVEACTSNGWGSISRSSSFVPEGDITLYAHYSHFYNVTFDGNGGNFYNNPDRLTMSVRIAESSSSYADWYSPTNPEAGVIFDGWYYDAACTRLAAARDGYFSPHRDLTLYAGWGRGYAVSFEANGGTDVPAAQTKIPGEDLQLSWDSPNREGFYFLGWAESPNADMAVYLPGESFTKDADTTLYALWGNPDFVLPESLTEIGEEAFADAAVRFVKLPDSTASVSPRAFARCTELRYIVIPDYLNQIDFSAFEGTEDVIVLTFSQFGRLFRLPDYMRMMAP